MGNSGADTEAAGPEPAAFIPALALPQKSVLKPALPPALYSGAKLLPSCTRQKSGTVSLPWSNRSMTWPVRITDSKLANAAAA